MALLVVSRVQIHYGLARSGRMTKAPVVMVPSGAGLLHCATHLLAPALPPLQVVPLPLKQSLPSAQIHAILSEFAEEDDAVSKVQLLIKYARMPPRLSQAEKTAANRVMGCTTQVWLTAKLDAAGTVQLAADSDAILPRGFAAVLVLALSGTRPEALLEMNLVALFGDLCLHAASLTPSRTNGFLNMLEAVRKRVRMLSTALPSCASLVIERDGIMPQVAFAEAPALYLHPEQSGVQELAAQLEASKMGVVAHSFMDSEVQGLLTFAAAVWPHIHIGDPMAVAQSAVGMAVAGCEAIAVLGVDTLKEHVRAILHEAGHSSVKVYRMDPATIGASLAVHVVNLDHMKRGPPGVVTPKSLHVELLNRSLHTKAQFSPGRRPLAPQLHVPSLGDRLRGDFPILHQNVNGQPLVYLDSGATSQKPTQVLRAMDEYYKEINSNVHRSVHHLSAQATTAYETARQKVASFINAHSWREIVFTRNASEAVNLVAHAWGTANLKPGDEIIVSVAEHHSVIVPMQMLAERTGAMLRHVGLTPDQRVDAEALKDMLGPKTRLVATVHVSNMLGSITDIADLSRAVHAVGGKLLVDACQSVPNMPVDVQQLGADWVVASAHKMCGPTGIGFLWGRYEVLDSMAPWMGGGEMIQDVFLDHSTYAEPPGRFEAGTPAIAEAIGLGAACDYLMSLGMENVADHEKQLGTYLYEQLSAVDGVDIYGPPPSVGRAALCSFNVKGLHAIDVTTVLNQSGVALRSGHHCTQPLHRKLGINASARASLYLYSTATDIDRFIEVLKDSVSFFRRMGL